MPFCSRILKAERLQKFYKDGDILVFGIGKKEEHRAKRLITVYQKISVKTGKWATLRFPLIEESVSKDDINHFIAEAGIEQPLLYKLGFEHNNCSGGCVRAGKRQWKRLYDILPETYLERERVEEDLREFLGKDVHYLKDETLKDFRYRIEHGLLPKMYYRDSPDVIECIGICDTIE